MNSQTTKLYFLLVESFDLTRNLNSCYCEFIQTSLKALWYTITKVSKILDIDTIDKFALKKYFSFYYYRFSYMVNL